MRAAELSLHGFWRSNREWLSPLNLFCFLVITLMGLGYRIGGKPFAMMGLPVPTPAGSSGIPHFEPKIFIFELILLLFFLLLGWNARKWLVADRLLRLRRSFAFDASLLILAAGILRMAPDFFDAPIVVLRNSSFVWYLLLSLVLAVIPLDLRVFERAAFLVAGVTYFYFAMSLIGTLLGDGRFPHLDWAPSVGLYGALFLGTILRSTLLGSALLFPIGFGVGIGFLGRFQRTSLVGLLLAILLVLFFAYRHFRPEFSRVLYRVGLFIVFIGLGVGVGYMKFDPAAWKDRLNKAEQGDHGMEMIRFSMWSDAFHEFLSRPLAGIGFKEQVVKRVYAGGGQFLPNTGGFEHPTAPPIAGPHNSYLNAIARMGLLGGLFLLLHLSVFHTLFKQEYFWLAGVSYGQMIYALFNVGLEGPMRSYLLLLGIGCAIQLQARTIRISKR